MQVTFLYIPAAADISSVCCTSSTGDNPVAAGSQFVVSAATAESLELTTENVEAVLDEVVFSEWQDPERDSTEHHHIACTAYSLSTTSCLQIRPYLISDGGNVELSEIDGPVVYLKLQGACGSCPSSTTTMTMGIRRRLMEKIPVCA